MKPLELYIHIPFCISKCKYCDFLSAPSTWKERNEYIDSLCRKIRFYREMGREYRLSTIFIGGGTPSILEISQMKAIFAAVRDTFQIEPDAEITVEVNPGTVDREKLSAYREIGINRLSIGLQSTDDRELKMLGRIHTYGEFLDTYQSARTVGFQNINVDLISAIPGQTVKSWEDTLKKTADLKPEHISAYSLIIEEGTPFYERYGNGAHADELPGEEEERRMYERTEEILTEYGYHRYEISNYAKPGYECRHNLGYWNRAEYLGIGTGAASLVDNCRWTEGGEAQKLTEEEQMEEYMFLGLRKTEGVSVGNFQRVFGKTVEEVYGKVIDTLTAQGLLERSGDMLRLTSRGVDISNYVMAEFLL